MLISVNDIEKFYKVMPEKEINHHIHISIQNSYIYIDYDHIGRFENFNQDFQSILNIIFSKFESQENLTVKSHTPHATKANSKLRDFYDREATNLVLDIYKDDFSSFNYSVKLPRAEE